MEERAYLDLHQLEQGHWWYRGTRSIYRTLMRRYVPRPCGSVLDLGCGTGGNLELLSDWGPVCGFDPWRPALRLCPPGVAMLVQGTARNLPFRDGAFSVVAILGVLEHIADDVGVLCEARRICCPGGVIVVLTSAFMFLWSQHDDANRHVRRYTARQLREKVERAGLRVQRLSYLNFFLFPLAASVRLLQRLNPGRGTPRMDMFPVPEPFSTALAGLLALEGWLMQWLELPLGVSLVTVVER